MTSSFTTRNRYNLQADGDNTNTWGDVMNAGVFQLIDASLDGGTYLTPAGPTTLTTGNGVADQARSRFLKFLAGSVASVTTIPPLEKTYFIWNASTAIQTIASSGGGASVQIQPGEAVWIACDGINVVRSTLLTMNGQQLSNVADPTSAQQAATKHYVDTEIAATAFSMGTFGIPIAPGNAGQLLTNNGSIPSWETPSVSILVDYVSDQATRAASLNATALAEANTAQTNAQAFAVCWALLF